MEHFTLRQTNTGLEINDFPDAIKVIQIKNVKTKELSDLALHKDDLVFALECLEELNNVSDNKKIIRQALWKSAIIYFTKCFGTSSSRSQIKPEQIFSQKQLGLEVYKYFKTLRNKHIVHDENSYSQSIPGAILNNGKKDFMIEKIVCLSIQSETLTQDNYNNLHLLITTTKNWVYKEFDLLCSIITIDLEKEPYDKLCQMKTMDFKVPSIQDITKKRK